MAFVRRFSLERAARIRGRKNAGGTSREVTLRYHRRALRQVRMRFETTDRRALIEAPFMPESFDFVVVGGGSAGAVIAARLSEDPRCRVALIEAGGQPPIEELIPAACPALQQNPETDWMYTADAGGCGRGLADRHMIVPRGKMLGGSSGINYMAYVRGHPGDFDAWAKGAPPAGVTARFSPISRRAKASRPATRSPSTTVRTTRPVRSGSRCARQF